jgi:hypothetical protein
MANVCVQCFADKELIAFINSQAQPANCSFCGANDVPCITIDELFDFFAELLSHFKPDGNGGMLKSVIQGNWNFFSSIDNASKILNHCLANGPQTAVSHADELVNFSDEILENVGYWAKLKEQLIKKSRYITDITYLTDELGWDGFFSSQIEIPQGQKLYRARLHNNSGVGPYPPDQMFCPPAALSTAGRANPSGIPYLYLSDNPNTVLYEVRATYLDEVSIGAFEVNPGNTRPVLIADFIESSTIFHPSKVGDKIKTTLLKQKISADLSKPMRRYDSELDYIPTQFICEFIKIYTGVSGIKFRSSLDITGNNFVIFEQNLLTCTSVDLVKVRQVRISA